MLASLSDFGDLADALRGPARIVIAVTVTLLVLSAFSVFVGGLSAAAEVVLLLATIINVVALIAAVGVLLVCRRNDRRREGQN
ncbi:hypothetical protein DWB78_16420 [Halopelagius longus]|uniref:Uncharacterized protein n=2 Tax=Halopelagius longus TaxID=1236180 RepID=A0A1H1FRK6_9EURY|nr:hypothetical protein DWB78_16420 [Halopelagius longus]SDR03495.1 hypothetical protein SAMN05216278_3369 [Halopelagius longus]